MKPAPLLFLIKLLTERQAFAPALHNLHSSSSLLSTFEIDNIPTEALMFQAGYLTIQDSETIGAERFITLRYPNLEVQQSLTASLLGALTHNAQADVVQRHRLYRLLQAGEVESLCPLFHAFFTSIPHDWYRKNQLAHYEGYYASIFYCYFAALGLEVAVEDATNRGRVDMAVKLKDRTLVFEFKVVELIPKGRALEQLQARGYGEKYRMEGRPVILIGVEFSKDSRNIVGFAMAKEVSVG